MVSYPGCQRVFFLSRVDYYRGFAAHNRSFAAHNRSFATHNRSFAAHNRSFAAHSRSFAAHNRSFAAHNRSFATKKNPSGTQGNGLPEFLQNLSRKFAHKIRDLCRYSSTVPEFCNVLWEKPVILAQLLLDLKIFVSHDSSSSVCKKCARKIVNCYKLFVELEKAFAVGCAVEEANESAPRTPTRERFLLLPTVLANSSNHSRAQRQYRMQGKQHVHGKFHIWSLESKFVET